jgi:hypothetical protein
MSCGTLTPKRNSGLPCTNVPLCQFLTGTGRRPHSQLTAKRDWNTQRPSAISEFEMSDEFEKYLPG